MVPSDHALIVVAPRNDAPADDQGLQALVQVDRGFGDRVVTAPSKDHVRLVLSPCGDLRGPADDVRRVGDAAAVGARAAFAMGAHQLSLSIDPQIPSLKHPADGAAFSYAALVAELAVRQAGYVPLQEVEAASPPKRLKLAHLVLKGADSRYSDLAFAIEAGRRLARDIGSADPERMAPLRVAEIVRKACEPAGVKVDVVDDAERLQREYPLLHAVARASLHVPRHRPCVVRLSWCGRGEKERTVLLAGKGVTYDTGGADVKVGGGMAGMRRDKCGAAAAVGFVLACAMAPEEQTRGLCVIAEIGCVRNSTGSDAYVADEIVVGHAGKRVLVGNTDMEGRMVLADCLSHLRQRAVEEKSPSPCILSLATLTGHALRSHGPYAVAMDTSAARAIGGVAPRLAEAGAALGQPIEVSHVRREDYGHVAPGTSGTPVSQYGGAYDVLQTSTAPSTLTARGHQFPAAFLSVASGLEEHRAGSATPLPYCHVDLAASVADAQGLETGSPIVPLFGHFVMRVAGAGPPRL